jgi:hypothetical protein
MKRRVFTRRLYAEIVALRRLRIATWIGGPAASAAMVWEMTQGTGVPTLGSVAFAAVAVTYTLSVYRVHEVTGEWTFF